LILLLLVGFLGFARKGNCAARKKKGVKRKTRNVIGGEGTQNSTKSVPVQNLSKGGKNRNGDTRGTILHNTVGPLASLMPIRISQKLGAEGGETVDAELE